MSTQSISAAKRAGDDLENDNVARSEELGPRDEPSFQRPFPGVEPWSQGQIASMPSMAMDVVGISRPKYDTVLWFLFQKEAGKEEALHRKWFECRRPTSNELWSSKYTDRAKLLAKGDLKKTIVTLHLHIEQATDISLRRRASTLLFDHIMFMRIRGMEEKHMDEYRAGFPDFEARFEHLAKGLQAERQIAPTSKPAPASASTQGAEAAATDERVSKGLREMMASWAEKPGKSSLAVRRIVGCDAAKAKLRDAVESCAYPTDHYVDMRQSINGVLLHGPPGTGKTQLAMHVANLANCTLYYVKPSQILSKYLGEPEKRANALFTVAQENCPSVIVFDEVDALFGDRLAQGQVDLISRLKSELLSLMTMCDRVLVIGVTNLPQAIDKAFLRRLDRKILVGLPDVKQRFEILQLKLSNCLHDLSKSQIEQLAVKCEGHTGDSIERALMILITEGLSKARRSTHFRSAKLNGKDAFYPCLESDEHAQALNVSDIHRSLSCEPITMAAFDAALDEQRAEEAEIVDAGLPPE